MKASVGSQLREARLLRRLTLEEVSKETHIKLHYLEALEADAFERLPSLFQARGFLRVYGSFLGLDSEALVNQLDSQKGSGDKPTSSFGSEQSPPSSASAAEPEAQGLENASRNDPPLRETSLSEQASGEAQAIFSQIGAELRRIRTHLGLSIEEVERQTHLRAHHIQIMEEGKFDRLASPMQGRGFLQIYASFLGLNSDVLLLRYAEALQAQLADRRGRVPRPRVEEVRPAHGQSYSWLWSAEFLIMVLLSIGTLAFTVWGLSGVIRTRASLPPTPTPFSVAEALLALEEEILTTATAPPPTPTATPLLEAITPSPAQESEQILTALPILPTPGKVQVILSVQQRAWLRVLVDEQELYNGRIAPGGLFEFNGEQKIEIQTGNAAALKVIYNRQDLGTLGRVGEVVTRIFTSQGVLEPTATITPTATRTLRPSPTPRPTLTPRPTRTFTPFPTAQP